MNAPVTNLPAPRPVSANGALMEPTSFDHMFRVGRMLAASPLFPDHLKKGGPDSAAATGVLVLNMANRLGEDVLTVAQNIHFVNGKPGWNATYMIARANQHGVFKDPIDWDVSGEGADLSVTAYATLASNGQRRMATADMAMAKAEGWTKNGKYQTMPEQMLVYRSATFLIRRYCPEILIGYPMADEVEDVEAGKLKDITPVEPAKPARAARPKPAAPEAPPPAGPTAPAGDVVEGEVLPPRDDTRPDGPAETAPPAAKAPVGADRATPRYDDDAPTPPAKQAEAAAQAAVAQQQQEQAALFEADAGGQAEDREGEEGDKIDGWLGMIHAELGDVESDADMAAIIASWGAEMQEMQSFAPKRYAVLMVAFDAKRVEVAA